jgi:hypothetical protein
MRTRSKSLSEVEYDGMLDAVRTAIAPSPPEEDFLAHPSTFNEPPRAANNNQLAWPLILLPEG